jgi:hypothetical protein
MIRELRLSDRKRLLPEDAHMKTERWFQFATTVTGEPFSARCSDCHREFIDKPRAKDWIDDLLLRISYAFDQQNCREDASQAGAES